MDPKRVKSFALAVGASEAKEVPPTYLTIFRDLEFKLFDQLGFSLSNVLHAEQDYVYFMPLSLGQKFTYETTLANVLEKKGATYTLTFLVIETTFDSQNAERLALSKTTVVIREPRHD